jgi:hypothetical protein
MEVLNHVKCTSAPPLPSPEALERNRRKQNRPLFLRSHRSTFHLELLRRRFRPVSPPPTPHTHIAFSLFTMFELFCCNCQYKYSRDEKKCPRCPHKKCRACFIHEKPPLTWACCRCKKRLAGEFPDPYVCKECGHIACRDCRKMERREPVEPVFESEDCDI